MVIDQFGPMQRTTDYAPYYNALMGASFADIMNDLTAASTSGNRASMQAAINEGMNFLEVQAPSLNSTGDTGALSSREVTDLDRALTNLGNGIPVNYHSPLAAALSPTKVLKDVGDSARAALASATEGATKGLGSVAVKVAAAIAGLIVLWIIAGTMARKGGGA
jgi:hypothetical protein